jgi:hypothetical protein
MSLKNHKFDLIFGLYNKAVRRTIVIIEVAQNNRRGVLVAQPGFFF